ncbi:MAG TPA: ABC transporter ATP-binding protein [Anaerolineae bacterium]|nr:ABC transporter ATP-binding protein [Anaerolineae bacterium]
MAATNSLIIQTEKLSRSFGRVVAVDQLDLEIKTGEIFGLVGPDGAGKTTIIRLLAAIMNPTAGRARVAGYDTVKQAEAIKSHIGYMAQEFSLYGDLSVQENMEFFADVFNVRGQDRRARIERLLAFAGLTEFTGRRGAKLSGGMKKKLGLACALVHQPDLLLLDEPTTGVDPVSRREFWDILTNLRLQGTTILVSTPYMDEAERCSRVGLIYQGRLIVADPPARIKQRVAGELIELRPVGANHSIGLLRRAVAVLSPLPGVLEIQTYGDLLHLFVDRAAERMPEIKVALAAHAIEAASLRQTQARMEEAFISLIRRQGAGEAVAASLGGVSSA